MDLSKLREPFEASQIDWRIGQAGSKASGEAWAKVLAYIDARAAMNRLDDSVGPGNWKDRYWKEAGGTMCAIAIKIDGEWVEKVDGSEDTDIEAFKGALSKAFVRAAVKWGVGRYLYEIGETWARIVPQGTDGSRYQRAKKDGKQPRENYEAFNWLPPELPPWALPNKGDKQPTPKPVGQRY